MCIIAPDCARIGEALLLSHGFTEASTLSQNLANVLDCLQCQVHVHIIMYTLCAAINLSDIGPMLFSMYMYMYLVSVVVCIIVP